MSDPDVLAALHQRRRDLELDAVAIKARVEEVAELIDLIEHPRRKRSRGALQVVTPPAPDPDTDTGDAA